MDKITYFCDICHKSTDTFLAPKNFKINRLGKEIAVESEARFCKECKEPVYDLELDQIASEKIIHSFNRLYGVTGQKIIDFRNKFNLSQSTLSKIIGIAKKTLISYETEQAIPSEHYLQLLKVIMEKPSVVGLFAKNSNQSFTMRELDKLSLPGLNDSFLTIQESQLEYQGYQVYQPEKAAELILFFCQKPASITLLNKALFYTDFSNYHENAVSITGAQYQKAPFGPMMNNLKVILDNLVSKNALIKTKVSTNNLEYYEFKSIQFKDFILLTELEQKIAKSVKHQIDKTSATIMSEVSHEESAWQKTVDWENISYHFAADLKTIFK